MPKNGYPVGPGKSVRGEATPITQRRARHAGRTSKDAMETAMAAIALASSGKSRFEKVVSAKQGTCSEF